VSGPTVSDIAELRRLLEEAEDAGKTVVRSAHDAKVCSRVPALLDRLESAEKVAQEMHEFADGEAQEWRYVWRELKDWAAQLRRKEER